MSADAVLAATPPPAERPLVCPACQAALGDLAAGLAGAGELTCPRCARRFAARVFAPAPPRGDVVRLAEAGPAAGAACAVHPGNLAQAACERCGVFCCGLCEVAVEDRRYCVACFERLRETKEVPFLVTRYQSLRAAARLVAVVGLLLWPFALVLGPVAIVLAARAAKQEDRLEPGSGRLGLWAIAALGLFDVAVFVAAVAAFVYAVQSA